MASTTWDTSKLGRWAVCSAGKLGRITGWQYPGVWIGVGLDGRPWQSTAPRFIAPNEIESLISTVGSPTVH